MVTNSAEHSAGTRHQATHFSWVKYLSFTTIHLGVCRGLCDVMTRPHFRAEELIPLLGSATGRMQKTARSWKKLLHPRASTFSLAAAISVQHQSKKAPGALQLPVALTKAPVNTVSQLNFSFCLIPNPSFPLHRCGS